MLVAPTTLGIPPGLPCGAKSVHLHFSKGFVGKKYCRKAALFSPASSRVVNVPLSGWSTDLKLFVIQRSKNTNEVQYQLHVNDRCHIVSARPVDAFWHLREVSPEHTAPLSALEHMAYGVTNQQVAENRVSFDLGVLEHFRALEQRRITATVRYDPHTATCTPSVQTAINGQVAALERIYVQADEGLVRPTVRYVDVYGTSLATRPTPVKERIDP